MTRSFNFLGQPPVTGIVTVASVPTGPATPPGGWTAVMADGFALSGPAIGADGSFWGPGDPRTTGSTAFNGTNQVAVAAWDNVTLTAAGCELACVYNPTSYGNNTDGDPMHYGGAVLWSSPVNGQGGMPGWSGITGCSYTPIGFSSAVTVFEMVATIPAVSTANGTQGSDAARWMEDNTGSNEIDVAEFAAVLDGFTTGGSAIWAAIDHTGGVDNQADAFGPGPSNIPSWMADGAEHTYTTQLTGGFLTQAWVDGNEVGATWPVAIPGAMSGNPMSQIIQYLFRNNAPDGYAAQAPTFTDTRTMVVRSDVIYQDTPHAGEGITGGGIQTGTEIA